MTDLLNQIHAAFSLNPGKTAIKGRAWLAISGGLDSVVLATVLSAYRKQYPMEVHAIHINHQLSAHADQWQTLVENICLEHSFPLIVQKFQCTPQPGESLEAHARNKRYAYFDACLAPGDQLLTAHHQEDQIETFFMHVLRGSGLAGLAAMPMLTSRGLVKHLRPFLTVSRAALLDYAKRHTLDWCEDESNANQNFDRNYWRHTLLPLIRARYPGYQKTISRSIHLLQSAQNILTDTISEAYQHCLESLDQLSWYRLKRYSLERQALILRYWFKANALPYPSSKKLAQILKTFSIVKADRNPVIHWAEIALRRYQHSLYLTPAHYPDLSKITLTWMSTNTLSLPENLGQLTLETTTKTRYLTVRFQQAGAVLYGSKQKIKKYYQQAKIPPWQRALYPLIYDEHNRLIAVADLKSSPAFSDNDFDKAKIIWHRGIFF